MWISSILLCKRMLLCFNCSIYIAKINRFNRDFITVHRRFSYREFSSEMQHFGSFTLTNMGVAIPLKNIIAKKYVKKHPRDWLRGAVGLNTDYSLRKSLI